MGKKLFSIFTTMFVMFLVAACSQDEQSLTGAYKAPEKETKVITVEVEPKDSTTVDLVDENGTPVVHFINWSRFAEVKTQPTQYADATEPWQPGQQLVREQLPVQAETNFTFNHGINTIGTNVKFIVAESKVYDLGDGRKVVLTKGQELSLYKPERLNLRGGEPATEVREGKLFYAETSVKYSLRYEDRVLAEGIQNFVAEEGYKPSFIRTVWNYKHDAFERNASLSNNIITVRCNNIANFCGEWDDNTYRDSLEVSYPVANKFAFSAAEIKVNDLTTVIGKTFSFTNGVVTIAGSEVKAIWQSAEVIGNVMYKNVNYKDSITACVCAARTITFNTASQATIKFYDHNANDYAETTVTVKVTENEKPVTLVRVDSTFVHNAFRSNAVVTGTNIAVICDNTGTFQKIWSNGKKDEKQSVKFIETLNFTLSMPAYISLDAKGKTYNFNGSTATVLGKNVIVTFTNRVIADIMFNNKNYKNDKAVPQCEVVVKTIKFGESTAIITFTHGSETVTAEVPVSYNTVKNYKLVGTPHHKSWNSVTGSYELTCNNYVTVVEVMMDDTEGNTFNLDYTSYNYWTAVGKIVAEVEDLSAVIGVPVAISSNGSVTIAGSSMSFTHSMKADKVTKGNFSYQPDACEAVAKTLTPISATQGRVDLYHGTSKVGSFIVPISLTEKPHNPDFVGRIIWGGATDSYNSVPNGVYEWHGCYLMFLVENNGVYTVHTRNINATSGWSTYQISSNLAATASNSTPLAYVGPNGEDAIGYLKSYDQGSWHKIVYYNADGSADKIIQEICKTIKGNNGNECRNPLRGTWSNGKITVDGKTYTITGSQN